MFCGCADVVGGGGRGDGGEGPRDCTPTHQANADCVAKLVRRVSRVRQRRIRPTTSERLIENQTSQPWGRPMRGIEHVSALGGPRGRWASDLDAIRRPRTSGTDDSLNPGDQRCTPVRSGRLRTRRFRLRRNHMLHMAAGLFHGVRRARHLAARAAPVAFAVALIVPPGGLTRTVPVALANGPTTVTFNFTGGPQMFT